MPFQPLRPCLEPRCPALVRSGRCQTHAHLSPARFADQRRGTATQRGYGAAWRRLRDAVLREEPLCRICSEERRVEPATTVDHIIPRAAGGDDSRENLRGLCSYHHRKKTGAEAAAIRRGDYAPGRRP